MHLIHPTPSRSLLEDAPIRTAKCSRWVGPEPPDWGAFSKMEMSWSMAEKQYTDPHAMVVLGRWNKLILFQLTKC